MTALIAVQRPSVHHARLLPAAVSPLAVSAFAGAALATTKEAA